MPEGHELGKFGCMRVERVRTCVIELSIVPNRITIDVREAYKYIYIMQAKGDGESDGEGQLGSEF